MCPIQPERREKLNGFQSISWSRPIEDACVEAFHHTNLLALVVAFTRVEVRRNASETEATPRLCCHYRFFSYSHWLRLAAEEQINRILYTQQYFTPQPMTGLQTIECGTGEIYPASDCVMLRRCPMAVDSSSNEGLTVASVCEKAVPRVAA